MSAVYSADARYWVKECAFVFDVKQAVRAGKDPYEMLCAMGEQLVHVHINDNTPQEDCLLPGRGIMDYERLRKMLQSFSYNSCILLEVYQKKKKKKKTLENYPKLWMQRPA